ncbi:CHAT domain-containing protein [Tengunoibacter tsumagoiensis]|uniref:CHAT domain-containing protein n=1 Tax=Tengunoibacter tsumagoiensis TaxID=2014871 RepID=UPI000F845BBC|nr:CHAT domain-containing protein [Tengunoibacter tsumagoiensis]
MSTDEQVFVHQLRDLPLEEGRIFIQAHLHELPPPDILKILLKDESLRQRDIHPFTALKLAEQLLFYSELVQSRSAYGFGLMAKGDSLSILGQEQATVDILEEAASIFLFLGEEVNWARTRIGWIVSSAWLGRAEEALQVAEEARAVFLRHQELLRVCALDHNCAVIYSQIGNYRKALETYERLLQIYATLPNQSEQFITHAIAMVKLNQGRNLSWLGEFEQARQLLEEASESFQALRHIGPWLRCEDGLAQLDVLQGHYGSALRRYYQMRDRSEQQQLASPTFAILMQRIASCLLKLNRITEANHLTAESVEICRRLGASLDVATALREYATTLIAGQRFKDALHVLDEAWTLFSEGKLLHHAMITRLQQTSLLLTMGQFYEAYEQASQLKTYFDERQLVVRATGARLVMAEALLQLMQQPEFLLSPAHKDAYQQEVRALTQEVIEFTRRYILREEGYRALYLLGQMAALEEHYAEAESYYEAAIEQIEQILENLVVDLLPAFLHSTWKVYEAMIALGLQQRRLAFAFQYLERARSLALRHYFVATQPDEQIRYEPSEIVLRQEKQAELLRIQTEFHEWQARYRRSSQQLESFDQILAPGVGRQALEQEVRRNEEKVSELFERLHLQQFVSSRTDEKPFLDRINRSSEYEVSRLQPYLREQQLLLAYFLYKGKLVILALTRDEIKCVEQENGIEVLERLLPPLYAHLEPGGWPDPLHPPQQAIRKLLHKLYGLLLAPIADWLPERSGELTIVPYGLLHNLPFHALYDGEQFLIERFQINYLPAASLLPQLHAEALEESKMAPVVFGYSGQGQLPRALEEAQMVQQLLHGVSFLESEATIGQLQQQVVGRPLIHLATHGQCRLDAPNFSYVRLADGQLNAIDAFGLNLKQCQLVTLSGCETGLALTGGGDEQLGLGRAFLAAGAASLVMSLWPVEDAATNELMILFYQHLLQGEGKAQALRAAQCDLLRRSSQSEAQYRHPYFWAAFRLVGNTAPLCFHQVEH